MTFKLQPWQASTLIGICGVFVVGTTLAFTNPNRQAYQSYASRQLREYLQENVCTQAFGEFLQQQCHHFIQTSQPYLESAVNLSTQRHNYILFSIYETQFSLGKEFPTYSAESVGFLNLFWTYESGIEINE
ncbi:MAG: DUF4359 domain-containing protein [Halothece sp.]